MKKTASSEAKQVDEIAPPAAEQQPEVIQPAASEAIQPAVEPVKVRAKMSGPGLLFTCYRSGGGHAPPCSLKFPSEILDESGLRANCEVELIASPGQITIKKIGDGPNTLYAYPSATEPKKGTVLAELIRLGKQKDEEMKRRRAGGEWIEDGTGEEEPAEGAR
jgi:hypothetical protein